jgi:hypothetical protein
MAPTIRSGDVVVIESVGEVAPVLGELVLVRCASTLRIHRVVSSSPLQTAGDNLDGRDPTVDEVLGRVRSVQKSPLSKLRGWARVVLKRAQRVVGSR